MKKLSSVFILSPMRCTINNKIFGYTLTNSSVTIDTPITILISYILIINSIAIILIDKCTTLFHFINLCTWRHTMR